MQKVSELQEDWIGRQSSGLLVFVRIHVHGGHLGTCSMYSSMVSRQECETRLSFRVYPPSTNSGVWSVWMCIAEKVRRGRK